MRQLLDLATQFSRDIDMKFGEPKCASMIIKKEIIEQVELTVMNDIIKNSMETGACYKYLGQDENICYVGPINKDRVRQRQRIYTKKEKQQDKHNKHNAFNAFTIPVLTPTFGIFNWIIQKTEHIDTKTRKTLCMTGNFHRNSMLIGYIYKESMVEEV